MHRNAQGTAELKSNELDVAIVGGGPAGSTVGSLLKKYAPELSVAILERETFPRDHVGESHLPAISAVLDEMGTWDAVEAADFPIKIGATYRWGSTDDLWSFEFLPGRPFQDEPRPAKYQGQRRETAFQVDRSVYDKILLDRARELGCEVREATKVESVATDGDRVSEIRLSGGESIRARHYVDASGASGLLRRKMGIEIEAPTNLRNIAIWDYWQNAEWAESVGTGGTRIQVLSLRWGWLWFIPVSETRTSIGLVLPAETYKAQGILPEALYLKAVAEEPRVAALVADARREGGLQTTNDWSYVAGRLTGENWFLAGDACGFADPILSAGMTLAHTSGRRVAYSILELDRGELDPGWIRREYDENHRAQIRHHIRFADFWYASNGCFTDLKENCAAIAAHAGLRLTADEAFRWLSTGGFALEDASYARAGTYRFSAVKKFTERFTEGRVDWALASTNEFRLDLVGASRETLPLYENGRIVPVPCYRRAEHLLPLHAVYRVVVGVLQQEPDAHRALNAIKRNLMATRMFASSGAAMQTAYEVLESMILDGWIKAKHNRKRPLVDFSAVFEAAR